MVRTQIYLDEREYESLRQEAFRRRRSISAILRQLIDERLIAKSQKKSQGLKEIVGIFKDKKTDVARYHDDYLAGLKK
jgi:hypothetical protein